MCDFHLDPTLHDGRPADCAGRDAVETACYDFLDSLGVPYQRVDHSETPSIEACGEVEKLLGIEICKNLFLCNRQQTAFYLLLMPGKKRFVTREFCAQIHSPRLSFGSPELLERTLDLTPGSVSILGLMNDSEKQVQLAIDREVYEEPYFGCHPCINTSSLKMESREIWDKFLPAVGHDPIFVDLKG